MSQNNKSINDIINDLIDFLHDDVLLDKLKNTTLNNEVCFGPTLWNDGYCYLPCPQEDTIRIMPIKNHFLKLLTDIQNIIRIQLVNPNDQNYDYKSQLDRFSCIITDIKNKVNSIIYSNMCDDTNISAALLATLIQTILNIVTVLENINTLLSTGASTCNCSCLNSRIFEIFMGLLINSISKLQCLLSDWYNIAVTFFAYSSCKPKPYVPSYVPKSYINQPKPPRSLSHVCPPCTPDVYGDKKKNNSGFNNINCT